MKRNLFIVMMTAILSTMGTHHAFAYDIAVENEGKTIYYNYSSDGTELIVTSGDNKYSGNVVIPEEVTYMNRTRKVTSIGSQAFLNCYGLTSVTIPNSVTSIGYEAFKGCSGLTSVTIPNSVKSIGDYAFSWCSSLTSVTIGNSVTFIGEYAFWCSNSLTSVEFHCAVIGNWFARDNHIEEIIIGEEVTSIGDEAFDGCNGLTSVHISDLAAWCSISFAGHYSNPLYFAHNLYLNGQEVKDLVIPNSVSYIGDYAFSRCSSLTSVTIPNSVTSIGEGAFFGCSGLTSVTIPNSVNSIGGGAFSWCSSLTTVTIPDSVISIGDSAFENCIGLSSVTIGNSVTSIGDGAFYYCIGLSSVTIGNSVKSIGDHTFRCCYGLTSLIIGNSVTSIGEYAFCDCIGLTSVTIPNNVTSIGYSAFINCIGLSSVTIPNSVTSIDQQAFCGCNGLTSVTIGNSVTTIGGWAFDGCENLAEVVSLIEEPFKIIGKNNKYKTFTLDVFNNATLYVPVGTIEKYKATEGWKDFVFIEEGTGSGNSQEPNEPEQCAKPTIGYSKGELTFSCATEGATCQYQITDDDIRSGSGSKVQLGVTYHISVYATKAGYSNSETATATLCWIDKEPVMTHDAIQSIEARPVLIQTNGQVVSISGAPEGSAIAIYDVAGQLVGSGKATAGTTDISTQLCNGDIAIVKIGSKAVKVVVK